MRLPFSTGQENQKFKGQVRIRQIRDGEVIKELNFRNLIVTVGKAGIVGQTNGVTTTPFTYVGLGKGATAAAAGNTALETECTESGLTRAAATCTRVTTTTTNDTAQWVKEFTNNSAGTVAVTESGLFDAVSSGILLARQVFSAVNLAQNDKLEVTWKVQAT